MNAVTNINEKTYYDKVRTFFNDKASYYDETDLQLYWNLSDDFFKEVLKKEIPRLLSNKKKIRLLDAGAGTGRWALNFYELFKDIYSISGDLIDLSPGMLAQAIEKISQSKLSHLFNCSVGNIEQMDVIQNNSYDLSISFYNVLSFVKYPRVALYEIAKKLKDKGVHISVVGSKYHAYYFSLQNNIKKNLELIDNNSMVKFHANMPPMHCFTPEEISTIYKQSGFRKVEVIGGLNFIYPGTAETGRCNSTNSIESLLSDKEHYQRILNLELDHYKDKNLSARGNTLLVIGIK